MKLCGIYLITHIESGRKYVGQSRDVSKRWYMHSRGLCKMKLGRSIAANGWESFKAEILELCSIESLNSREEYWIRQLNTMSPNGYNLTSGGGQSASCSPQTRAAMSAAKKGTKMSDETKRKMTEIGKNRSPEYRAKIGAANSSRVVTSETRAKLRAAKLNQSAETRAKIGAAGKGRIPTPEQKTKAVANKAANRLLRDVFAGSA